MVDAALFSWIRPRSYWDVVGLHFPIALVSGIALIVPHWISLELVPLKHCTFLSLTGYSCPFCGFTRAFWAISTGDWAFAAHNCPLACLLYGAVSIIFAWHASGLLLGLKVARGRFLRPKPGWVPWIVSIICTLFAINWAFRVGFGLQ